VKKSQDEAAGGQRHRDLRENVGEDGDRRQIPAARRPVTALEKLRHRDDPAAQVEGNEHPRERQHHEHGQPLEVADGQPGARARPRQPDEVLARDVGREQRRADGDPADAPIRQKISLTGLGFAEVIRRHAEHDEEVGGNDDEIERGQSVLRGPRIILEPALHHFYYSPAFFRWRRVSA
jgi:hypothetical protein